jgi:hypothetical protein
MPKNLHFRVVACPDGALRPQVTEPSVALGSALCNLQTDVEISASRMRVAVAAILLALSGLPSPAWAEGQSAQTAAPSSEIPKEGPSTGSQMPPSAEILDPSMIETVLGREVRSVADENMGRIVDVIVDLSGQVRAAVIDFGGFLGVGSRKIAVDWNILRFGSGEKPARVVVDLTQAQLKAAPEYKDGKPAVILGALPATPPSESGPAQSR